MYLYPLVIKRGDNRKPLLKMELFLGKSSINRECLIATFDYQRVPRTPLSTLEALHVLLFHHSGQCWWHDVAHRINPECCSTATSAIRFTASALP